MAYVLYDSYSQISPNPCGDNTLYGLASGLISLGKPSTQYAQAAYIKTLSGSILGTYSDVFNAFAVAGLSGPSNQQFYSLIVDTVIFSNGNTQMNITMSYSSPDGNFQTMWSSIKLSYVLVSTAIQTVTFTGGSYVWAGSVGLYAPFNNGIPGPVMYDSLWQSTSVGADTSSACGYVNAYPPYFDINCAGSPNAEFVTHLYIMGFQFDPSGGSYSLAASVLRNSGTYSLNDLDESQQTFTIKELGSTNYMSGPNMLIDTVGTQLRFIKVGIVITTILDINAYPIYNTANFLYSGIYMPFTSYNIAQTVSLTPRTTSGGQNYNFYDSLTQTVQIYGLSSFYISKLAPEVTVINYEISFPTSTSVLFNTDDVNYMSSVRISSDGWNFACNNKVIQQVLPSTNLNTST